MMSLCCDVLKVLSGKTLATAESCTGGLIGGGLTAVAGCSAVYKGGIICYTNEIKHALLEVPTELLERDGAVSASVAKAMADGAKKVLNADVAVSVTGLAGPGGDEFGNPVGTVYIGYSDGNTSLARHFLFDGDRSQVRSQAAAAALKLILEFQI